VAAGEFDIPRIEDPIAATIGVSGDGRGGVPLVIAVAAVGVVFGARLGFKGSIGIVLDDDVPGAPLLTAVACQAPSMTGLRGLTVVPGCSGWYTKVPASPVIAMELVPTSR
jgi:hypothetical protein